MDVKELKSKWPWKSVNKQASVDLWNSMAQGFGEHAPPSLENSTFLQLLEKNQMYGPGCDVLDVGCGTGGYSLALAGRCRKVVGVDLSPDMLAIAAGRAVEQHAGNVTFSCADWHELDLEQAGFRKKFDLVFARMTPAVQSADTFLKLCEASRGWCALTKPTRRTDPVSDAVKRLLGISDRRESGDGDILLAFEYLWTQGMQPRPLEHETQRWSMRKTPEEAFRLYGNRMKTYRALTAGEEKMILDYLASIAEDGMVCEDVDTTITTLYWHI